MISFILDSRKLFPSLPKVPGTNVFLCKKERENSMAFDYTYIILGFKDILA